MTEAAGIKLDLAVTIHAGVPGAPMREVATATLDTTVAATLTPTPEGATLTLNPETVRAVITAGMEAFARAVGHHP